MTYAVAEQQSQAEELAHQLQLPLVEEGSSIDHLLNLTSTHLQLEQPKTRIGAIFVDFSTGKVGHRFRYGGGKGQLIAKAVGLNKVKSPDVLDLTAGLGRDAFVLASLGCRVKMVERSPIVAALLRDGLQRAVDVPEIAEVVARMKLVESEALQTLQREEISPAVCYLDPMYPHSRKSALPGKEMMLFRGVVGEDQDAEQLLSAARKIATKRVVVKRPRKAELLGGQKPDFQMTGKSTRYDVYLPD